MTSRKLVPGVTQTNKPCAILTDLFHPVAQNVTENPQRAPWNNNNNNNDNTEFDGRRQNISAMDMRSVVKKKRETDPLCPRV